jgi:hypothetical protein
MKNIVKIIAYMSVATTLSACHSDKPSLSEAKAPFEAWVGSCKYVTLTSFDVVNGRKTGDTGHIFEIRYSVHLQLDDNQIVGLKDWAQKKQAYEQEHDESLAYDARLVASGGIPNRDAGSIALWNRWAAAMRARDAAMSPDRVQEQIQQSCPNLPGHVINDLLSKGHMSQSGESALTYRAEQSYALTDNGWTAAD